MIHLSTITTRTHQPRLGFIPLNTPTNNSSSSPNMVLFDEDPVTVRLPPAKTPLRHSTNNNTAHPPNDPQLPHRQRPPIHLPHPLFPLHPPQRPFSTSKRPTHPTRPTHAKSPASTRNTRFRDITPRPCCPRL
jgi:hypothetical protein